MARNRALLVNDGDQACDRMQQLLERENFDVVSASNIPNAIGRIVTQDFDALITDCICRIEEMALHWSQPCTMFTGGANHSG
jgi:DNA-binding NtrC family response regulator